MEEFYLSICELEHKYNTLNKIQSLISKKEKQYGCSIKGIYIGSNFCARYFLKHVKKTLNLLKNKYDITVCIPLSTEKYIKEVQKAVEELSKEKVDFSVNDYGMFALGS